MPLGDEDGTDDIDTLLNSFRTSAGTSNGVKSQMPLFGSTYSVAPLQSILNSSLPSIGDINGGANHISSDGLTNIHNFRNKTISAPIDSVSTTSAFSELTGLMPGLKPLRDRYLAVSLGKMNAPVLQVCYSSIDDIITCIF